MADENIIVTEEGLKELEKELEYTKTARRKEVAERLKEAISYGDLSENSEYQQAKEEQGFIEGRIIDLEKKIKYAKVITSSTKGTNVRIGSTVDMKNLSAGTVEKYTLVGTTEADPMQGKISNESPLGAVLLGKKKGEKVLVDAPSGKFEYEIVEIL
ncbi:MAG: transcription elongation factor GreA [Candidatus Peregrinibacteria bacterium]